MTDHPIITEALRRYARQRRADRRTSQNYNISQMFTCARKEYLYRLLGNSPETTGVGERKLVPLPADDGSLFKMDTGVINEEFRVTPALDSIEAEEPFSEPPVQVYLFIPEYGYSGKIDRIVGLPDDPHPVEFKFTQAESFRYALKEQNKWIRDGYLLQILTYYWFRHYIVSDYWRDRLTNCKKCRLYVSAMDRQLEQEVLVYPDERRLIYWETTGSMVETRLPEQFTKEIIESWMRQMKQYWEDRKLPPLLSGDDKYPCEYRTGYCPFVPFCFGRIPGKVYKGTMPITKDEYTLMLKGERNESQG